MSKELLQKENSQVHKEVLQSNLQYSGDFGDKGKLGIPPARKFAILTCMDARLDPAHFAGLVEGDAHVIRNAGGRASDDAIRSLIISHKLLGTQEWFVIHHTQCGMELFTDSVIRDLLSESLKTATIDENSWKNVEHEGGSRAADFIPFLTIKNLESSVVEDVERIKLHPLVAKDIPVYGYIYEVESGRLMEVPRATELGRAR